MEAEGAVSKLSGTLFEYMYFVERVIRGDGSAHGDKYLYGGS